MNRIPSLDGWRGIAIALVLFDHIQESLLHRYLSPWSSTGYPGVMFFFVLSGFLITSKLIEGINLKSFYVRRFFRLIPVAWVFLGVLLLLSRVSGRPCTTPAEVLACVFFCRNFFGFMGIAGHFWSLSVEEQFYLLWPVTILLAGVYRCRWIALLGAISCAMFRWIFWARYGAGFPAGPTILHADGLLIGSFLALLIDSPKIRSDITRWSRIWGPAALSVLLLGIYLHREECWFFEQISLAALIASTTLHPHSLLARLVSFRPLAWLGTVSYSIYVWQELFMPFRSIWAICLFMPVTALASYYFLERPITRFGHRVTMNPNKVPVLKEPKTAQAFKL